MLERESSPQERETEREQTMSYTYLDYFDWGAKKKIGNY